MKKCPACAEEIQDEARKCKHCGEFIGAIEPRRMSPQAQSLRAVGVFAAMIGLAATLYFALVFDTSVEVPTQKIGGMWAGGGRVNNLGLMQDRQTGIELGSGTLALGVWFSRSWAW